MTQEPEEMGSNWRAGLGNESTSRQLWRSISENAKSYRSLVGLCWLHWGILASGGLVPSGLSPGGRTNENSVLGHTSEIEKQCSDRFIMRCTPAGLSSSPRQRTLRLHDHARRRSPEKISTHG